MPTTPPSSPRPDASGNRWNPFHALSCRRTLHLISRSLDERLPWPQRALLHTHLAYCFLCRRYRRQLAVLRQAMPELAGHLSVPESSALAPEARDRLRAALQRELENPRAEE